MNVYRTLDIKVDQFNLAAIEWLELFGNFKPTESQIQAMETLLRTIHLREVKIFMPEGISKSKLH